MEFSKKRIIELRKSPSFNRKTFNEQMDQLLNETAEYLNQFHPKKLNPKSYEGVFGYYRFKRIIHPVPRLRGTDAFGYLALRQPLFRMYDRLAISFDFAGKRSVGFPLLYQPWYNL